jgi:hypothetical protein
VSDDADALRQDVIEAAVAYCLGTEPDDHPLDDQLRSAVARLTGDDAGADSALDSLDP